MNADKVFLRDTIKKSSSGKCGSCSRAHISFVSERRDMGRSLIYRVGSQEVFLNSDLIVATDLNGRLHSMIVPP